MIQIVKKRRGILFYDLGELKELKDVPTLFKNVEKIVTFIPKAERYNIYYTLAHHKKGLRNASEGSFIKQEVIAFDIDHIKDLDVNKAKKYITPVCTSLGVDPSKTGVVLSGNGVHFIIQIKEFTSQDYFTKNKKLYTYACDLITAALKDYGLEGSVDKGIFDAARILRLPFTENRKPKEGNKQCLLINGNIELQELSISMPHAEPPKGIKKEVIEFGKPDIEEIVKECAFINWCKDNPEEVVEPQWYSLLSITSRFEDDDKISHEISSGYSGYTFEETAVKIEQSKEASPPKTCETISSQWSGCAKCKYYNKIKSPITLRSEDFVATAHCGFTTMNMKGGLTRHYKDLYLQFNKEHRYKSVGGVSKIYKYNGTHYEIMDKKEIKNYALRSFKPLSKSNERDEFFRLIEDSNFIGAQFINGEMTEEFINFQNGILDIEHMKLLEHTEEYPFFYCLPFDYDPKAKCPAWNKFIKDFTLDRECLGNILHEYMGYTITNGRYRYQNALILSGTGKNGKTTYINTLRNLLGVENYSNISISSIKDDKFAVAGLHGKLANFSEEEPPICFKETGMFKTITGNAMVTAQYKYGDTFQMLNKAKLIISYNELPYMGDTSVGMKRRLLIVPCDLNLEDNADKVDIELQTKLNNELSGIFNNALKGWFRLEKQKYFTKSTHVTEAVEEVLEHSDIIYSFLKEELIVDSGKKGYVLFNTIYNQYCNYNSKYGTGKNITKNSFSRKLTQKSIETNKKKINGNVQRVVMGYVLKKQTKQEKNGVKKKF